MKMQNELRINKLANTNTQIAPEQQIDQWNLRELPITKT